MLRRDYNEEPKFEFKSKITTSHVCPRYDRVVYVIQVRNWVKKLRKSQSVI